MRAPGWPSAFPAWYAYQGNKVEETVGLAFYANYNGYPTPEADFSGRRASWWASCPS